ncbi:MAG TPA: DUF1353 domain-containing protein [bacterium]|nr:DUF1353 domain-containing protein [bacterium]
MPFGTLDWEETDGSWSFDFDLTQEPAVELRQTGRETFRLLKSFCYEVPHGDPDARTVYVVPGGDGPAPWRQTKRHTSDGRAVIFPPNPKCGETDLASVPWFMWWLVATYGNHTRAVLLHDALIVDKGKPPIPRTAADRLLLRALRERGQKTGVFRHWLMWAAVSVFGTMGKLPGALLSAHVFAFWGLLLGALLWAWGPTIWAWWPAMWPDSWDWTSGVPDWVWKASLTLVGGVITICLLLTLLGAAWRAGVDNTGGWLIAIGLIGSISVGLLLLELPWSLRLEWSPFNLLLGALVLLLSGVAWGAVVDRSLWGWLWPTALIGLPIATIPVVLIFVSVYLVRFIDEGAARVRAHQRDPVTGEKIGYQRPDPRPTHFPPL